MFGRKLDYSGERWYKCMTEKKKGDIKQGGRVVALTEERVAREARGKREKNAMSDFFQLCDTHFKPCSDEECDDVIKRVRQKKE